MLVLAFWSTLAVAFATMLRRLLRVDQPALLLQDDSERLRLLIGRIPSLREYRPPPLLPTGLLQSAFAEKYAPEMIETPFSRQTVRLAALRNSQSTCCPRFVPEGIVSIDWLQQSPVDAPICILIPGLTGSSSSGYIRRAALALHQTGVRVGCFNPRSRGGNDLISGFLYSAGYTEDLRRVIALVQCEFPRAPLTAAGFSLGSNYLAKYVAEEGPRCPLAGAVALACPLELNSMSAALGSTVTSRFLDRFVLVRSVQRVLQSVLPKVATIDGVDLSRAVGARSMLDFDDATIAPMMGCSSATVYYSEASVRPILDRVRVPLLFVSAENDPIAPPYSAFDKLDFVEAGQHSPIVLAVTAEGGHSMTWPEGFLADGSWACRVIVEWVSSISEENCSSPVAPSSSTSHGGVIH